MIGNDNNGFDAKAISKAELGGEIIKQTLDTMNSCAPGSTGASNTMNSKCDKPSTSDNISSSYNFNKDVLSSAYSTKGALFNSGT